jgi:hypothetical protein
MGNAAILRDRAVISVEGPDARDFLQGVVTNDMTRCPDGQAIYAALLTPQGKILFDFFVIATGTRLLLDCAASSAEELMKRLGFYRLRAKVSISLAPDFVIAALWGAPAPGIAGTLIFPDPRLQSLGTRLAAEIGPVEAALAPIAAGDYEIFRLQLGVPESADFPPDQVFALDAGMEELHGVSFTKGCYIGQEVTARMKHRSTARRRFYMIETEGAALPGTVVEADGRELGRISSGKSGIGLALVRMDRVADAIASGAQVLAQGRPARLTKPGWLHE